MGKFAGSLSFMSLAQNSGRRRSLDRSEGEGGVNLYSLRDRDRAGNLTHAAAKFTGLFLEVDDASRT